MSLLLAIALAASSSAPKSGPEFIYGHRKLGLSQTECDRRFPVDLKRRPDSWKPNVACSSIPDSKLPPAVLEGNKLCLSIIAEAKAKGFRLKPFVMTRGKMEVTCTP